MSVKNKRDNRDEISTRIDDVQSYDIDHTQRIIYLTGVDDVDYENGADPGVEYRQSNRFIRNINILSSLDAEKPILVILKNPGGYCDEGMAIYDAIHAAPMPITMLSYGGISSMATVIFQSANKRVIMPNTIFMFHMGTVSASGTPKQVINQIEYDKIWWDKMIDIYVDAMKSSPHGKAHHWSKKRIREWLTEQMDKKEDVWLTAEQTVEWGFADEIFAGWPSLLTYTDEELERK